MKWRKQITEAWNDEKVAALVAKKGLAGYGAWCRMLDIVAAAIPTRGPNSGKCSVTYPVSTWAHLMSLRGSHVRHWLSEMAVTHLLTAEWIGSECRVTIPNLLKYRDEKSHRAEVHPPKEQNRTDIEHTPPKPPTREKRSLETYPEDFEAFWKSYPRQVGKGKALSEWKKINPKNGLCEVIVASVIEHCHCHDWTKDHGQFIPHPSTFLHQRRWEDSVSKHSTEIDLPYIDMSQYHYEDDPRKRH